MCCGDDVLVLRDDIELLATGFGVVVAAAVAYVSGRAAVPACG